ncbi:uncharacterized protein EMH_0070680 [Eimeria mitis]|uniref:Uncharacterized protein n=1 Tax=Eimeria mitis TaxID=44415 RepID=U6KAQ1_9EIME|nr:uncharacterized protein EMH_0070680 [Eimeria mitis]CDJ35110.1 hypothetical protein, conserved [Eimeria mitis]
MLYGDRRWAKVPYEPRLSPAPPLVSPRYFSLSGGSRLGIAGPSYRSLYTRPRRYKMGNTYSKHYQLPTVSSLVRATMPEFLRKRPIKIMRDGSCRFLHANASVPLQIQQSTQQEDGGANAIAETAAAVAAEAATAAATAAAEIGTGQIHTLTTNQAQSNLRPLHPVQQILQAQNTPCMHAGFQLTAASQQEGTNALGAPAPGLPYLPAFATTPSYPVYSPGGNDQAGAPPPCFSPYIGATFAVTPWVVPFCWPSGPPAAAAGAPDASSPPPSAHKGAAEGTPGVRSNAPEGAPYGWWGPPGCSNTAAGFVPPPVSWHSPYAAVQQQMPGGPYAGPLHSRGLSSAEASNQEKAKKQNATGLEGTPLATRGTGTQQHSAGEGPPAATASAADHAGDPAAAGRAAGAPDAKGNRGPPGTTDPGASPGAKGEEDGHSAADAKALW